jgi:IMP dehydrogenase
MTHLRNDKTALTYDDIQLVPSYSEIESRAKIDLSTQLTTNYRIQIPLIASPMDTVCDSDMAIVMAQLGGVGCIHRFMTIEQQAEEVQNVKFAVYDSSIINDWGDDVVPIMAAVGANGDYLERTHELTKAGANVILIDVAHGHHKFVREAIGKIKSNFPTVDVIAGNIATAEAAEDLESWGADGLRVGIGGGSLCTTRIKTGFGVPNVTSLLDVASVANVPVIACGGIRTSGDIAKAIACGADSVILGSLLAGTKESPGAILEKPQGLYKRYRGAASLETKSIHGQATRNVEGESTVVPFKGGAKFIIDGLLDGLRSALSYAGADDILTFNPEFRVVTNAGMAEAKPHLL